MSNECIHKLFFRKKFNNGDLVLLYISTLNSAYEFNSQNITPKAHTLLMGLANTCYVSINM